MNEIRKTFLDGAVQIRIYMDAGSGTQTDKASFIASCDRTNNIYGQRKASLLDRMDERTGEKQVTGKTHRLRKTDISGAGSAVMAEDNMAEFTGKAAPDGIKGEILIICHDILYFITTDMEGNGILILTEEGNKFVTLHTNIVRKLSKGHGQHAGGAFDDRQGNNRRSGDIVEQKRAEGGSGRKFKIRGHCHYLPYH